MRRVACKRRLEFADLLRMIAISGFVLFADWGHSARADDVPKPQATGTATAAQPAASDAKSPAAEAGKPAKKENEISTAEQLEFQQAKISAEMAELEQRMFRLAETLKPLEPENSSRLVLGVRLARDELILHQMKEVQKQLRNASLAESVIEQKQLLAKLERLEQLLLSFDLDFQMRLERLRQIREVLRRLETVIREEDREYRLSEQASSKAKRVAENEKRSATLQQLIERETAHLEQLMTLGEPSAEATADADDPKAKLTAEQTKTREDTTALIPPKEESSPPIESLIQASKEMASAEKELSGEKPAAAEPSMQAALAALRKALTESQSESAELQAALSAERFTTMAKDQAGNRQSTEGISEMVRGLGNNGAEALGELIKAGGSMAHAEGELKQRQPAPAGKQQEMALASLKYAREKLAIEAQRLQDQLRAEVKKRTIEGLVLMLEQQVMVREATESLSKRVAQGSRQAQASVVGLANSEGKIIALADELITLAEETEFGIALPAALHVVRDEMEAVQASLRESKANADVIAAEKQIEADLEGLLDAMKQMPATGKGEGGGNGGNAEDQERELNRLIAELKMIRLLETRVQQDTSATDRGRENSPAISTALRRQIEQLTGHQEDVRDVTERLALERDLDQP
jgi:hypothetical protein